MRMQEMQMESMLMDESLIGLFVASMDSEQAKEPRQEECHAYVATHALVIPKPKVDSPKSFPIPADAAGGKDAWIGLDQDPYGSAVFIAKGSCSVNSTKTPARA